jgi:hypothetical protein
MSAPKPKRQVRTLDLPAEQSAALVDLLVSEVIDHHSIALTAPPDGIEEPAELRRTDGSSVYTVAGADSYTPTHPRRRTTPPRRRRPTRRHRRRHIIS